MSLTKLFDSEFRGGRADCAAKTRTSHGSKVTMAEADVEALVELLAMEDQSRNDLIMPHNVYEASLLDSLYPPLKVPEAVDAGDPQADVKDPLVEAGLEEASRVMHEAELQGRRRRGIYTIKELQEVTPDASTYAHKSPRSTPDASAYVHKSPGPMFSHP